ncbi:MAG TPA: zinc ribbon domain-containing protein [Gemmatimonadales bacterium]|nr:zinc ribbon domain-containing protein [Gemmatimonadales bacterium]
MAMPTYEYRCPQGHEFEKFQKMSDTARVKCPVCGKVASRKISGGAGFVFKGSGFYITDYGKDGKGPRKAPDESAPKTEAKPEKTAKSEKSDTSPSQPEPKADKAKKASE